MLTDAFGRQITYLRLSVTDRCNLHCRYCMPATGIPRKSSKELLTWEELIRLTRIFLDLGIKKVRITGGEPFMRKGLLDFLDTIRRFKTLQELHLTTNGVAAAPHIQQLHEIGISGINLSLDTLSRSKFEEITGSDRLKEVLTTFNTLLEYGIPLKINTVVKAGFNTDELLDIARLAESHPVEVRFIEEMPLIGTGESEYPQWDSGKIMALLRTGLTELMPLPRSSSTAKRFAVRGFAGRIGIIAGHSRTFCSECNRTRVTASGFLQTCLYSQGELNLKRLIRSGASDDQLIQLIRKRIRERAADGFVAYRNRGHIPAESMVSIGG